MKKSLLIIAMGVFGTAALAQDAETNIIQSKKLKNQVKFQNTEAQTKAVTPSESQVLQPSKQVATKGKPSKRNVDTVKLKQKPVILKTVTKKKTVQTEVEK